LHVTHLDPALAAPAHIRRCACSPTTLAHVHVRCCTCSLTT